MRIVFISPGFPADHSDDTSLPAMQSYVTALAERSTWDVHVIALQYPFSYSSYKIGKLSVHAMGGANRSRLGQIAIWKRAREKLEKLHSESPIDLVHSFWLGKTTLLGQSMTARYGIKHIASIGGQEVRSPNLLLKLIKWDKLILTAGSEFAARTFTDRGGAPTNAIVPFGLDLEGLKGLENAERDIDLIGVGSLIRLKQYDQFLTLVSKVAVDFPKLRVVLVGDGPERNRLEKHAVSLGVDDRLEFKGHLPRKDVIDLMHRSKILLHPSEYESQGYVFLEALFCGLDVVANPVGYLPDSKKVWPCQSMDEMAKTIVDILHQDQGYDSEVYWTANDSIKAFVKLYGFNPISDSRDSLTS